MMSKEVFKTLLIRDKGFLKSLYEGEDKSKRFRILKSVSDTKLNTLIRFLHFLSNGEIKIKKVNFDIIQENRKLNFIKRHVEKNSALKTLLESEREEKIKFLKQLIGIYPALLYCLFNEN